MSTDPLCHNSPNLSRKPDFSTLFQEIKNVQIEGCTVLNLYNFLVPKKFKPIPEDFSNEDAFLKNIVEIYDKELSLSDIKVIVFF